MRRATAFSAADEAARQLGRIIVGAPADGSAYDLAVTFTLHRGAEARTCVVQRTHITGAQIIETPFAFVGPVITQWWAADIALTWRGVTWRQEYHSPTYAPAIYCWHATVFEPQDAPTLQEVAAGETMVWKTYRQTETSLPNLTAPHHIRFRNEYRAALAAGQPLAGYLKTTLTVPQAQRVQLVFRTGGPTRIFLDGDEIPIAPHPQEAHLRAYFRSAKRTLPFEVTAGEHTLIIDTMPPQTGQPDWYFGASLLDEAGQPVPAVKFS